MEKVGAGNENLTSCLDKSRDKVEDFWVWNDRDEHVVCVYVSLCFQSACC